MSTHTLSTPRFTLAGCLTGVRRVAPVMPGVIVFACAFGAAAVAKGLTLGQAVAMSAFVYAGVSQMVAMELWRGEWTVGALAGLALVTAAVNGRMILQGASLQRWLADYPRLTNFLHLATLTDASWLIGERYRAEGGRDLGVMVGAALALWVVWVAFTVPGYMAGALLPDPRVFGLDLLMPIFFVAMLVPLWRGAGAALPWLVAGVAALATSWLVEGYAFIVVGALAGAVAGAFGDDR